MITENTYRGIIAIPKTKYLGKNLIGALLILIFSALTTVTILMPDMMRLFRLAVLSQDVFAWTNVAAGLLFVGFLIAFPVFLVIQGFVYYWDARKLDRMGVRTKGLVIEKWADTSAGNPVYHICYKYLLDMNALQTVSENVFQQLECDQSIDVLHLEHAPQVSRMLLES